MLNAIAVRNSDVARFTPVPFSELDAAFSFPGSRVWRTRTTGGPMHFLGGGTIFSGHYVTRQTVILTKSGMTCSLLSPAMSLTVEFGIVVRMHSVLDYVAPDVFNSG